MIAQKAPDNFLLGSIADNLIVDNAEPNAVDAHIGRAAIGTGALRHLLPDRNQKREGIDIAVVVDRLLAIRLKVVRIDHVAVIEIDGRRLVSDIERVVKRKVPDRERFELRVSCNAPHAVFVVDLRKAGSELARTGTWRSDDHNRLFGLDVFVLAVAHVGNDSVDIGGIARRQIVVIDPNAAPLKLGAELPRRRLLLIARNDHSAHYQPEIAQVVDELHRVIRV